MIDERNELETQVSIEFGGDEMSGEKAQNVKGTMKRFFKDLMQKKWKIFFIFLCLAASAVCSVLSPKMLGNAIDHIFNGIKAAASQGAVFSVNFSTMGGIILLLLALYLLGTLLNYVSQRILASVSQEVSLELQRTYQQQAEQTSFAIF